MAITDTSDRSTWIKAVGYCRVDGPLPLTLLAIFTTQKIKETGEMVPAAILYGNVPSHLPGRLVSGHTTAKDDGELSIGATYAGQVKGRYPSQTIVGENEVNRLKEMMTS